MLMTKHVAEVLKTTVSEVMRATRSLGNVGRKSHRQGVLFSSDDIDRIKEFLASNPKR